MKEITYTYEIISKNETKKTFDVKYVSEGRESVTLTLDYPYLNGMDLELLIQRHSPVFGWELAERPRADVDVGKSGIIHVQFPEQE